ncbi:RNA-binding motif protein, X-linked 2-like [Sinocyclocheilus rhinocerous]|uniref:RNA-binding motif protein, X-linked 2-like n=1 Tax=Sinocyclocheilus rhinocerous TaxID=307959 RepID=UPI0007B938E4|nr:PREDICTED: RNA-binding motif protein, X-linked 2-like [Sinocyclocheilus rhinocerous]
MNPLTKVKLINELNEKEAELDVKDSVSWHSVYKESAWIFIGGLPYELTEGDAICVFSQYGEIANINLVRDKKTGKSKGFCFLCYEDQRSTILAVDNFNGIKIKGRTIRVDHVANYRPPKDNEDIDDVTKCLREEGCAPKVPLPSSFESGSEEEYAVPVKKPKKDKKEKKKKKEKKEKKKALKEEKHEARTEPSASSPVRVKNEKEDTAYEKYAAKGPAGSRRDRQDFRNPQDRADEVDRFRDRYRGERERDREENKKTDRNREDKRHEDTRQGDRERDKGRGVDRENNGERERERERERDRDRRERDRGNDRGFTKHRDHRRMKQGESKMPWERDRCLVVSFDMVYVLSLSWSYNKLQEVDALHCHPNAVGVMPHRPGSLELPSGLVIYMQERSKTCKYHDRFTNFEVIYKKV